MEKNNKMCMDCAYLTPNSMSMLTYCTLNHPPKYVHHMNLACDKWSDVAKRELPIKCCMCGEDGVMVGKNSLPNGWGNLLGPDNHFCPSCYEKMAQFNDREFVNRKPDKTRTIVRSVERFYSECFRM